MNSCISDDEWRKGVARIAHELAVILSNDPNYQEHRAELQGALQCISECALYLEGKLSN
jgi:hypothetical protein